MAAGITPQPPEGGALQLPIGSCILLMTNEQVN